MTGRLRLLSKVIKGTIRKVLEDSRTEIRQRTSLLLDALIERINIPEKYKKREQLKSGKSRDENMTFLSPESV